MTSVDETRETPQRQTAEFGRLRIDFDDRVLRPARVDRRTSPPGRPS